MSGGIKETDAASASADMVIAPAFLVLRNLSYRRRVDREWISPSGARVTSGDGTVDVAHGVLDRLVFCLLATRARSAGRTFHGRPHELRVMFGLSSPTDDAIAESLARVAFSVLQFPPSTHKCSCRCRALSDRATVVDDYSYCRKSGQFSIKLSRAFADEARAGIAVSAAVLARFAERPPQASLIDLYVWLMQRMRTADLVALPIDGPNSVSSVLTIAKYDGRAREIFAKRLTDVHQAWPECPFVLSTDPWSLVYAGPPESAKAPDATESAPAPSAAANESQDAATPAMPPWFANVAPSAAAPEPQPEREPTTPKAESASPEPQAADSTSGDAGMPRDPYIAQALALAMMQLEQSVSAWQTVASANVRAPTAPTPETASDPASDPAATNEHKRCGSD